MDFERDHYAILGVASDADEQSIKRAYRRLARRYHPDTSSEKNAAERFHEIQAAYELLIDAQQREAYDHWRSRQGLDTPKALLVRVTPSQDVLPCLGEPQILYVLIELSASAELESRRWPINLSLVLDRSTSMRGARLQQVKEAARYIADQMGPKDVLSLVAFSDRAQLVLSGSVGIDKTAARSAIGGIRAGGGTEILQGLKLGFAEVQKHADPDSEWLKHIILLTDGQTYGDEQGCLELAREAGKQRVPITAMGIGSDWNDQLLDEVANLSGSVGGAIYIDASAKIATAFRDRIHGLGTVFADNLVLSLHQVKGVSVQAAYRVAPEIHPLHLADGVAALGVLEKKRPQAIMLELLVDSHTPGQHRLLQVEVQGEVPLMGRQEVRVQQSLTLGFEANLDRHAPIPPDIVSAMGKLTIYKMQERAMADIELGQIDAAVDRLKTMATRLLNLGESELARAALLEAGRLAHTGSLSAEGRKRIRYGTRGLTILPKEVRND